MPPASGGEGSTAVYGSTSNVNIIPISVCSAMWQWAIHFPGLVTSRRTDLHLIADIQRPGNLVVAAAAFLVDELPDHAPKSG